MIEEIFLPGNSVSRVERTHGMPRNRPFGWPRKAASGGLAPTRAAHSRNSGENLFLLALILASSHK